MANKNFTMKEKTASGYDNLYPKTTAQNVLVDPEGKETVAEAIKRIEETLEKLGGSGTGSVIDGGEF